MLFCNIKLIRFVLLTCNFYSIPDTSSKTRKSKGEMTEDLEDSIINSDWNENKELEEKASKVKINEDAAAVIREFKEIIKSKKRNIVYLAYQQGKVFIKFKENEKFSEMVKQFEISKSTIIIKTNTIKVIDSTLR